MLKLGQNIWNKNKSEEVRADLIWKDSIIFQKIGLDALVETSGQEAYLTDPIIDYYGDKTVIEIDATRGEQTIADEISSLLQDQ